MAEDLKPTAPQQPPAPVAPIAHRLLATGEVVSLALAVLTLVGCAATLFAFLGTAVIQAGTVTPPAPTGDQQKDNANFSRFTTTELYRQQARGEERTGVLRSCGVLVGVAVAFLALGLLLAAARDPAATAAARLARVTPGLVALACATLIIIMSAPESKPAAPPSGFPFTVPQTGLPIAQ